jgi:hypothetical protein
MDRKVVNSWSTGWIAIEKEDSSEKWSKSLKLSESMPWREENGSKSGVLFEMVKRGRSCGNQQPLGQMRKSGKIASEPKKRMGSGGRNSAAVEHLPSPL